MKMLSDYPQLGDHYLITTVAKQLSSTFNFSDVLSSKIYNSTLNSQFMPPSEAGWRNNDVIYV